MEPDIEIANIMLSLKTMDINSLDEEPMSSFVMYDNDSKHFNDYLQKSFLDVKDYYKTQIESASCDAATTEFILQNQQKFVSKYINEQTPFRGLLVWHGLGSGKTCAAIAASNTFKKTNIKLIAPAALINNFKIDYQKCGDPSYIPFIVPEGDTKKREKKRIDCKHKDCNPSDTVFNKMEEAKFVYYSSNGNANNYHPNHKSLFENKLIIIDESQIIINTITNAVLQKNINNTKNSDSAKIKSNTPYSFIRLYDDLRKLEKSKFILLSGTPIVNSQLELYILFNIIHGDIFSWNVPTTYQTVEDCINSIQDEESKKKLRLNIDFSKSKVENGVLSLIKNPFNYVNEESKPNHIKYDDKMSIDRDGFTKLINEVFSSNVVPENKPLFDISKDTNLSPSDFYNKIKGLASYFGNIETIMPKVKLNECGDTKFLEENNLYRYSQGFSNTFKPLYEIRYVNKSKYYDAFNKFNQNSSLMCESDKNKTYKTTSLAAFGNEFDLFGLSNQFIYPNVYKYFENSETSACSVKKISEYTKTELSNNKRDAVNKLNTIDPNTIRNRKTFELQLGIVPNKVTTTTDINMDDHIKNCGRLEKEKLKITGEQGESSELKDFSPKIYEIMKSIVSNEGIHIIYSEYLAVNYPLLQALQANGFTEFTDPNTSEHNPRYMFYTGKSDKLESKQLKFIQQISKNSPEIIGGNPTNHLINTNVFNFDTHSVDEELDDTLNNTVSDDNLSTMSTAIRSFTPVSNIDSTVTEDWSTQKKRVEGKAQKNRDSLLKSFNDEKNNEGKLCKVIIINSAAAEGITIKNVRFVHLLHLPPNISKLFQIIGRAIRNCTHKTLDKEKQTVTPILYLDQTNEKKFTESVIKNRKNIPFLELVKQSTIDCELNKQIDTSQICISTDTSTTTHKLWLGYKLCSGPKYDVGPYTAEIDVNILDMINGKTSGGKKRTTRKSHKYKKSSTRRMKLKHHKYSRKYNF